MPPKRPARKTLHSAFIHSLPPKLTLDKLTPEHLRRTYGLAPCLPGDLLELPQCPARWNGVEGGEMAEDDDDEIEIVEPVGTSRKGKGKGKPAKGGKCSLEGCVGNPRCANWLGQEKWEDEDKSLKPFLRGLVDPTSVRDPELPVGLKNLGATCYVNSLLQVWFQDETFRSGVYACQPPSSEDVDSSPLFQLQLLFSFLQTARQAVYNPVTLVSALKLDTGEQQDAQEFSKLFMNLLDQQFKKQNLLDDRVGGVKVKRLVEEQFEGQVVYGIECSVCHHRSERQTKFSELEVTLIKDCKLEDRIRESLKEELMTGDNQYHCEGCSAKRDARRFTLLPHLPPVLHFSLMRFVFSAVTYERSKSNHAISYPFKLDMGQFLSRDAQGGTQEAWYDLKGVLMHKGQSAHHGHYVAQVHDARRKKWFLFDDETVSPIDDLNAPDRYDEEESEVLSAKRLKARAKVGFVRSKNGDLLPKSKDAYMLIYTRREMDPDQPQREEPVPQPLAEMRVEQLDEQHESLVKEYATHSTEMRCEFDRLREEKREVYRTWDVLPDEEGFLVSKDELKRWMREGLVPPKKIEEVKSTSEEDIKLDDASPPTSAIVPVESFPVESLPVVASTSADEVKVLDPSDEMDLDAKKITLIDNQGLVCPHGKANPVKAEHFKRIGKRGVEALLKLGVTIEPALELPNALCRECVWGMVAETTYSSSHQQRVKEISSVLHDGEQTTYLSRIWYNDWIKTNPKMHVTNSIADPHPSSGSFARDVLCEHGNLQPEPKKRILISAEATALLESIFPDWQAVSTSTDSCDICERTFVDYKANTHELKRLAAEEKLAFKSFDQQTRLIGSQLLLVRGKDHYIIPKAFPREWVKWQRSKGDPKNPRPLPIDNSPFLCEHQKVLIDIKSEVDNPVKIDVTSEKDWKSLQKRYDAGPQIKIWEDELSGMVKTFPEICEECVDRERKSFDSTELKIKFLSAADFDASGARTQEIILPSSPEVEIMSSTKKRFSSASTLVTPTRSSKRIKQGPQMRANKKMQRIEMSKGDTIRDLKIKIAERLSIPTIYQKLYYNLKELDSAETVAELGLCGGDVVELFEVKMDDDEVDLSKLDDGIERKERRNGKKGREEGFGGTGLFGYEEMNGGGCGAEGTSETEMGFELRRDGGKESSSGTGTGTEMIEEEMDDHVNCPQCTFAQSLSNEACEVCDSAL